MNPLNIFDPDKITSIQEGWDAYKKTCEVISQREMNEDEFRSFCAGASVGAILMERGLSPKDELQDLAMKGMAESLSKMEKHAEGDPEKMELVRKLKELMSSGDESAEGFWKDFKKRE